MPRARLRSPTPPAPRRGPAPRAPGRQTRSAAKPESAPIEASSGQAKPAGGREARAQARQRRIRLSVEAVDRQMRPLDQPVLPAQLERTQEQTLEQSRIDETAGVCVRQRLMHRQLLGQAIAEEAAQVEAHPRLAQQLARRTNPLPRARHHQRVREIAAVRLRLRLARNQRAARRSIPTSNVHCGSLGFDPSCASI